MPDWRVQFVKEGSCTDSRYIYTGEQEGRNWLVNGKVFPEMSINGMDLSVVWIEEKVSDGRYLQRKNRGANDG